MNDALIAAHKLAGPRRIDDGYRALAAALVLGAVREARAGWSEARSWLLEQDSEIWLDILDLDPDVIKAWLAADCPNGRQRRNGRRQWRRPERSS
jgi:hypothetical protein